MPSTESIAWISVVALAFAVWQLANRTKKQARQLERLERNSSTERASLLAQNQRLTYLATMPDQPVLLVDQQRHVLWLNTAAKQAFDPRIGPDDPTLIALTRNHELEASVDLVLAGEPQLDEQLPLGERTYRIQISAYEEAASKQRMAVLVLQDVSEQLRLSRARRDMVANFSHDLGTPITNIQLLVDTLLLNLGKNPERDQKQLAKIGVTMSSLHHMTQELITLASIESGKLITRLVPSSLYALVSQTSSLMDAQFDQKNIALINTLVETSPHDQVLADPEQLKRVILNILHNGVKFTSTRGHIRLSSQRKAGPDALVQVSIEDDGPGIAPSERMRIFERFYQVDSARTESSKHGTGLGLAIAKHIIEAHGGTIWAEAAVPTGARICFTLRLANP
jgi:two-component system, OmpR family, phosphate regulon sensor histidine kinase PhoR